MFAFRHSLKHGNVDIAILTDSNQYIEYSLEFRVAYLSQYSAKRIRSLFEPYLIDKNTDVAVNELMDDSHPLYLYFMLIRQHIGFRLQTIDKARITSRINYHYKRVGLSSPKFSYIWQLIIDKKHCPWITQHVEYALQNKGPAQANRIRFLRIAMFYLVVKNYLYRSVKKSKDKDNVYRCMI